MSRALEISSPVPAPAPAPAPAPLGRRRATVADARAVGAYGLLGVDDPMGAPPWPGQFYMLACADGWGAGEDQRPYLPRACSVARVRSQAGRTLLEFLLEDVGPGTGRLLRAAAGDQLWIMGPLGVGFGLPGGASPAILVGGGAGVAPLVIWQEALRAAGRTCRTLVGFRSARHAEAAGLLPDARVATDDGSVGRSGAVTELLAAELETAAGGATELGAAAPGQPGPPVVYACGPPAMLEAVRIMCAGHGIAAQLALEAPMACGYGACFGCVVATEQGYARVCVDGPVFAAERLLALDPPADG